MNNNATEAKKISPSNPVIAEVWNICGARCSFNGCNKYLLQDELTTNKVRLAQVAHIVARSVNGPRGSYNLPIEDRNNISNLMLACPEHHKLIDAKEKENEYPVELLREYKNKHESRIKYLTGLGEDFGTTVLRVLGSIRGNNVSVTPEEIRNSVLKDNGLYPEYIGNENDIEINLQGLPAKINSSYWETGINIINEKISTLIEPQLERSQVKQISVFALARIPLLIHLGSKLTNKARVHLHQLQNTDPQGWSWHESKSFDFSLNKIQEGSDKDCVVLVLSLSGQIEKDILPADIDIKYTIYTITPNGIDPSRDLFRSRQTLYNFRNLYQKTLRQIEKDHPKSVIHLFPAIPSPVAIICGQEILREITPDIIIYDRIDENYQQTITINNYDN